MPVWTATGYLLTGEKGSCVSMRCGVYGMGGQGPGKRNKLFHPLKSGLYSNAQMNTCHCHAFWNSSDIKIKHVQGVIFFEAEDIPSMNTQLAPGTHDLFPTQGNHFPLSFLRQWFLWLGVKLFPTSIILFSLREHPTQTLYELEKSSGNM